MKILQFGQDLTLPEFNIQDGVIFACDGAGFKNLLLAGTRWLEIHINIVNGLNVFPVPDGDTGTNMVLTMQSALTEMKQTPGRRAGNMATAAAHGALMGARGNSGVILSEFLQGLALGLKGKAVFRAKDFAFAAELGVERAYQSVLNPVEGTILTVARAAAEAARQGALTNQDLTAILSRMVEAAKIAQAHTPNLLPVLKKAGVTDSGGQGLLYILEGAFRYINNEPINLEVANNVVPTLQSTLGVDEAAYGYDVQFLLQGEGLNIEEIRAYIDNIGESTIVVGDGQTIKVHVHVKDPGLPLSYAVKLGIINDVVVENMEQQAKAFVHEHAIPTFQQAPFVISDGLELVDIATIAVVPGQGFTEIFQSLGVTRVINGGQSMNPSTQEVLDVVNQIDAKNVLILPNNGNIILTVQQAQKFSNKNLEVLSTKTLPQGIAALIAFNHQIDLKTNIQRMAEALAEVRTIEVTEAVRQTTSNGFDINVGDVIGFLDNSLVGMGQDLNEVALDILTQVNITAYEIITIYIGQGNSYKQASILVKSINQLYTDLEIEILNGEQPHYHYIISLE